MAHGHDPPFNLQEVVEGTKTKLTQKAEELRQRTGNGTSATAAATVNIILIGHSVGAYILLETLAWWRQAQQTPRSVLPFTIVSGIPLFPTILHIRLSSKGRILTPLLSLPFLPYVAQYLSRILAVIPTWLWDWPRALTPGEKRSDHCAVTEAILRSRQGARQVVYLARDEMRCIREDKWHPARLWGVLEHEGEVVRGSVEDEERQRLVDVSQVEVCGESLGDGEKLRTKLFFYWGDDDYWVDNGIRDRFIAERAKRNGDGKTKHWPEMIIDRHGMDHCFSLNDAHSKLVAIQVAEWIEGLKGTI